MSGRRQLLDAATRMRTGRAKSAVVVTALAAFGVAYGLTRVSHPSHTKHSLKALAPPSRFVQQLRRDERLRGGFVAPPQAPPEAQTAAS